MADLKQHFPNTWFYEGACGAEHECRGVTLRCDGDHGHATSPEDPHHAVVDSRDVYWFDDGSEMPQK